MQLLGTLPRYPLAQCISPMFFTREHTERQGMEMQILQSAALLPPSPLLGVLMPAQNSSCPGFTQHAMFNTNFKAHCTERDILPALDCLSHQAFSQSRGRGTAPKTKTRPPGCRCPRLSAMRYKAQLENVFRREHSTGDGLRAALRYPGVFGNAGWAPQIHRQGPPPHAQMAQVLLKALGEHGAIVLHHPCIPTAIEEWPSPSPLPGDCLF